MADNGVFTPNETAPQGTTTTLVCNSGYTLSGDATYTCGAGGQWNGDGVCRKGTGTDAMKLFS